MTDTHTNSTFISVHTLTNRFEADILVEALRNEEIPVVLRTFEETPYNGLFISQRGWGVLMVPEDCAARAQELLNIAVRDLESKRLYDDPRQIDPRLWEDLRNSDSGQICTAAQVRHSSREGGYLVPFLDTELWCLPHEETIKPVKPSHFHRLNFELYLVLLHYLLESRIEPLSGKWISEKDIPGGQTFFSGPHKFPTDPLLRLFGSGVDVFSSAAELLGGTRVPNMGDAAYRFWVFPRLPLILLLWAGDEEFEPVLHIRFDGTIKAHLHALDTIWAMVNVVCRSLRSAARHVIENNPPHLVP